MTQHSRNRVTWLGFYSGATLLFETFDRKEWHNTVEIESRDSVSTVAPTLLFRTFDRKEWHNTVEIESRDSVSTVAPPCSLGLFDRKEWHNTVEIESRDCQDMMRGSAVNEKEKLQ